MILTPSQSSTSELNNRYAACSTQTLMTAKKRKQRK
jgi:hypothetical protein